MTILLTGHHLEFYNEVVKDVFLIKDKRIVPVEDFQNMRKGLEEIYDQELS